MNESIPLSEKLYLLGIHPQKSGLIFSVRNAMDFIILGSLFLELYLARNVHFENNRLILLNSKSENKTHALLLEKIASTDRNLRIRRWFNKFNFLRKYIRSSLQKNLTDKKMIRLEDRRFLFFKWKTPVLLNKQVVYHLVDEINSIVFKGTTSDEELLLILLLQPAGLMRRIFQTRERRIEAINRIKNIVTTNQSLEAVSNAAQIVKAVKASIIAANATHYAVV